MSEGDGMAEVTEVPLLVRVRVNRPGEPERWVVGAISKNDPAIAAALAEERRKARAPFLALADEAEACAKEQKPTPGTLTAGVAIGMRTVASSIRRTADLTITREETP